MHIPSAAANTPAAILRRLVRAALLTVAVGLLGTPSAAQDQRLGLAHFKHTRWTVDDGAPTGISRIAQTPDGWLWIAASDGLFRFDGVTFERIAPPVGSPMERASPSALLVSRSGELWVGFAQNGGVAIYRDGRLRAVPMSEPPSRILGMVQAADGAIWATAGTSYHDRRLHRWNGTRWQSLDARLGLPDGFPGAPCLTADGTLWIGIPGHDGVVFFSLPPRASRFHASPVRAEKTGACSTDREGRLWIADKESTRLAVGSDGLSVARRVAYPAIPGVESTNLAFDAAGGLWGATNSVGIFYVAEVGKAHAAAHPVERFVAADGLTSDVIRKPFVDREGNIWFGSELGLDRFRSAVAVREPRMKGDPGLGFAMSVAERELFVSTERAVYRIAPGGAQKVLDGGLFGICPARGGGFWGVLDTRIFRFNGVVQSVLSPPPGEALIGTCAEDPSGHLWIGIMPGGAMWHDAKGWHRMIRPGPVMQEPDLVVTPNDDVAYVAASDLVRLNSDGATAIDLRPYDIGTITKIAAGPADIFVSGNNGLLRIRGHRITRIDARRFPWVARLRGLVQTSRGETWLRSNQWISRVSTADLDRAFDDPRVPLKRLYYDLRDGLSPSQNAVFPGPQLGVGSDGRIVMVERPGLSYIDPAKLREDVSPPPVVIRSASSGGRVYRDPVRLTLPAGTHALDIDYAGLNLTTPHRTQFRYRLEGVDDDWVLPGTRRLASYGNLGPGTYRFAVSAANSDGIWNTKAATLIFEIPPTFAQSWPFKLLCAVVVLALLWLAYSLRLRSVAGRIRMRMAERMEERERIARDLHDTLLQSVQALTLRFQLVVDELPVTERARPALEAAIDRADQVIAEGRDRVKELRLPQDGNGIEQVLTDIVAQQGFEPAVVVSIEAVGTPRALDPLALDEIARIAGEAIFNIRRHAHATRIAIEIRHHASFAISFVDNGIGIDPAVTARGGKNGHFGLPGMRERARKLDGDLIIRRLAEGGTQVLLTVPGRIAYKKPKRRWFSRWWDS